MVIQSKIDTPYINLDKENYTLSIKGKCYPNNPSLLYNTISQELGKYREYLKNSKIII